MSEDTGLVGCTQSMLVVLSYSSLTAVDVAVIPLKLFPINANRPDSDNNISWYGVARLHTPIQAHNLTLKAPCVKGALLMDNSSSENPPCEFSVFARVQ